MRKLLTPTALAGFVILLGVIACTGMLFYLTLRLAARILGALIGALAP